VTRSSDREAGNFLAREGTLSGVFNRKPGTHTKKKCARVRDATATWFLRLTGRFPKGAGLFPTAGFRPVLAGDVLLLPTAWLFFFPQTFGGVGLKSAGLRENLPRKLLSRFFYPLVFLCRFFLPRNPCPRAGKQLDPRLFRGLLGGRGLIPAR